jgi:hypothetical protein
VVASEVFDRSDRRFLAGGKRAGDDRSIAGRSHGRIGARNHAGLRRGNLFRSDRAILAHGQNREGQNGSRSQGQMIARKTAEGIRERAPPRTFFHNSGELFRPQLAIKLVPKLGGRALGTLQTKEIFNGDRALVFLIHHLRM